MSIWGIFGKSAANEAAERILAAVMQAGRDPDLFGEDRAPDTMDGRFEIATAFAALALMRLQASPEADRVAQIFTDKLFRLFDAGLREAGVGDLSVARRMKALAGAFYGRLGAYRASIGDPAALAAALSRNVWNSENIAFSHTLAALMRTLHARHGEAPAEGLELPESWRTMM